MARSPLCSLFEFIIAARSGDLRSRAIFPSNLHAHPAWPACGKTCGKIVVKRHREKYFVTPFRFSENFFLATRIYLSKPAILVSVARNQGSPKAGHLHFGEKKKVANHRQVFQITLAL
jgi:hypothetical protein